MGGKSQGVISLKKSQILSYSFWLLHQGGQACLVPFFSLYIRQLGMNGAQTGLIIAVSFASCMVALPLWKWVSGKLGQYRIVILGCLLGTIVFNLLLVAIPPIIPAYSHMYCSGGRLENASWWSHFIEQINKANKNNTTLVTPLFDSVTQTLPRNNVTVNSSPVQTTFSPLYVSVPFSESVTTSIEANNEKKKETRTLHNFKRTTVKNLKGFNNTVLHSGKRDEIRTNLGVVSKKPTDNSIDANAQEYNYKEDSQVADNFVYERKTRDLFTSAYEGLSNQLSSLKDQVQTFQHQTVLVTILVLLFASVFGSAVGPLFDEAWFEFLDDIDEVELYGRHQIWGGVGRVVTPVIAACFVDGTPCLLGDGKNHMVIHIYLMAVFTFCSLIVAFFQPVYGKLSTHQPKLLKGIKLLFTDVHCGSLAFTVLIVGLLSSSMHMFMLWVAEDLQSIESPMGLALGIGGATRLVMMGSGRPLVEKLSPAKVVALGLLALAVQLIFVSYLWSPWALIVTEGLTGLSQGAIWQAVQHHPDFALHLSNTERSVFTILHVSYEAIALPIGCIVSGFVYDHLGPSTLFQAAALIAVLWCVVFVLIQACVPKEKRLQYSELIGAADDDTKISYDYEDDWLEAALKNS